MDEDYTMIKAIAEDGNGFVRTSQIEAAGINRSAIKKYVGSGMLERIRKGIYAPANCDIDEFALLQAQCSSLIFSYGTALYIWGLTDIIPHIFDVSVPHGENISRLLRDNKKVRAHYIMKEFYSLGITEARSPQGTAIRLYDRERCLCDLIRDKHQIEKQLYVQAIKEYFKTQPDVRKLLRYGTFFGIEEKTRTYIEVLE